MNLSALDELEQYTRKGMNAPGPIDFLYYLFWDKGIDYTRFSELPIPYILGILSTHQYIKKLEAENAKKMNKSKKENLI